jgi:DNA mismatch repair protein MutS
LENREKLRSGIPTLKVKQAAGFGYSFEVSRSNASKVPSDYERRQTLTNVERFVTPELKKFETEIFSAEADASQLEKELFIEIQLKISGFSNAIKQAAQTIADLDVLSSFAELAVEQNYCCPVMTEGEELWIEGGRHPVVEQVIGNQNFVANNTLLDAGHRRFALLTGPNMGGKSTYLRQIGLIQLLAQIGSFVPAKKATLGMVDRIYTRIGASDDLSRGESTFMVEMRETSTILRRSTRKSLVLIDEVGRGTATADGHAIALAVSDYLLDTIGCRTIFATHFHELTTQLAREGVFFLAVGVEEIDEHISLTHKILEQIGDKSYGIEVAKLAGLPSAVIERAQIYLTASDKIAGGEMKIEIEKIKPDPRGKKYDALIEMLSNADPNNLTPLESLAFLSTLKEKFKS